MENNMKNMENMASTESTLAEAAQEPAEESTPTQNARARASLRCLAVDVLAFRDAVCAQTMLALSALATVPAERHADLSSELARELVHEETQQCVAADAWAVDIDAALVALERGGAPADAWRVGTRVKALLARSTTALESERLSSSVHACAPALVDADVAARLLLAAAAPESACGPARARFLLRLRRFDLSCDGDVDAAFGAATDAAFGAATDAAFAAALMCSNVSVLKVLLSDPRVASTRTRPELESALCVAIDTSDADVVAQLLGDCRVDHAVRNNAVVKQAADRLLTAHRRVRKQAALVLAHVLQDPRVGLYDNCFFSASTAFRAAWSAWRESASASAREVNAPMLVLLGDTSGRFNNIWLIHQYMASCTYHRGRLLRLMLDSPGCAFQFHLNAVPSSHAARLLLSHPRTAASISSHVLLEAMEVRFSLVSRDARWSRSIVSTSERTLCDILVVLVNDARFPWDSEEFVRAFTDVAALELVSHTGLRLLLDDSRLPLRARHAAVRRLQSLLRRASFSARAHDKRDALDTIEGYLDIVAAQKSTLALLTAYA